MYRVINTFTFATMVVTFLTVNLFWKNYCSEIKCSVELMDYFLGPLITTTLSFAFSVLLVIAFKEKLNKYWLYGLFIWLCPLLVYNGMGLHLGELGGDQPSLGVWISGVLFFIITFLFATAWYLWWYKKGEITKKELSKLLFVIPIGVIFYFARDIFFW